MDLFETSDISREFNNIVRQRKAKTFNQLKMILDLDHLYTKNYCIINTPLLFYSCLEAIKKAKIIAIDTETTGLRIHRLSKKNALKDKIVGMSISWERNQGIYIPFEHTEFKNMDKALALRELRPYLESKSIVCHNGLFDGKVFYDEGIRINITQDTLLLFFNLDSTVSKGSKALKRLIKNRYGHDVIELSDIFDSSEDAGLFCYVEEEVAKYYACGDTDYTLTLLLDSYNELLPGQRKAYALDIKVQMQLIRSEYYGKGIDMSILPELHDIFVEDGNRLANFIYKYTAMFLANKYNKQVHEDTQYRFNISSSEDLVQLFFTHMNYPIPDKYKDEDSISVDKHTLKALTDIKATSTDPIIENLLQTDILSAMSHKGYEWLDKDEQILVSKAELSAVECKLALLISKYRKLEKLRSSFFAPLLNNNYEGVYYSSIHMTRAETARVVDNIQTLDKSLKRLVIPYDPENQYLLDYDQAQIEYRTMVGESGFESLKIKLDNSEADYHREGGQTILGKPADMITSDERSGLKSVNFGIPYAMSAEGMLANRYGIGLKEPERSKKLAEIEDILARWNATMIPIRDMLNNYRDRALILVKDSALPTHLKGKQIGRIANALGRTRVFDLSNLSKSKIAAIRRQAGNFPIQSFARDVFFMGVIDFCNRCVESGLMDIRVPDETQASGYRFENKVVIIAYIHDECLMCVNNDVNPYYLYKLIYESCMRTIPGHPRYFCGINVIDNWYEGKDDKFEAPVGFVEDIIATEPPVFVEPRKDHKERVLKDISLWYVERIRRELLSIDSRTADGYFDLSLLMPNFRNYFVKPKIAVYIGLHRKLKDKKDNAEMTLVSIESFALHVFEHPRFKTEDGEYYTLSRQENKQVYKEVYVKESYEHREWAANLEDIFSEFDDEFEDSRDNIIDVTIDEDILDSFINSYDYEDKPLGFAFKR